MKTLKSMKTLKIVSIVILVLLATSISYAQELNNIESKFAEKPIVEMTLNGKKIWALLDTGSEYTILNIRSKKQFGFDSYRLNRAEYKFQGLGTELNHMYTIRKAKINFHEVELKGNILAFDLTNIVKSIEQRTGKRITAIIGTKMMRHHGFIIDMSSNRIVLADISANSVVSVSGKLDSN
jgi:hypothetical protein